MILSSVPLNTLCNRFPTVEHFGRIVLTTDIKVWGKNERICVQLILHILQHLLRTGVKRGGSGLGV